MSNRDLYLHNSSLHPGICNTSLCNSCNLAVGEVTPHSTHSYQRRPQGKGCFQTLIYLWLQSGFNTLGWNSASWERPAESWWLSVPVWIITLLVSICSANNFSILRDSQIVFYTNHTWNMKYNNPLGRYRFGVGESFSYKTEIWRQIQALRSKHHLQCKYFWLLTRRNWNNPC